MGHPNRRGADRGPARRGAHAGGQSAERQRPGAEHGGVRLCRASARRCGWTTWPMPGRLAGPSVAAAVRARLVLAPSGARPRRSRSRARRCMTAVRSGSPGRGALCLQYHWGATSPLRNQATPPFASLRSRIPRPCAHRSRWRRPRVPSRARLRQGWGAFFPGGGKFPPHLVPPVGFEQNPRRPSWAQGGHPGFVLVQLASTYALT